MNKDNKIILFAVIILLVGMFSSNSLDNIDITGKAASIEKCYIKLAKWSSTPYRNVYKTKNSLKIN